MIAYRSLSEHSSGTVDMSEISIEKRLNFCKILAVIFLRQFQPPASWLKITISRSGLHLFLTNTKHANARLSNSLTKLTFASEAIKKMTFSPAFATPLSLSNRFLQQFEFKGSVRTTRDFRHTTRKRVIPSACAKAPTASIEELKKGIAKDVIDATEAVKGTNDLRELDSIRVSYLGKKGSLTTVLKVVGTLPREERPLLGQSVNKAKEEVSSLIAERKQQIIDEERRAEEKDEWIDVTMPGIRPRPSLGKIHPLTSTTDMAVSIFRNLGYDLIDDPDLNREIETDYYCFEALNCPPHHPAREMQDTFYLDESKTTLLRTQTSAVQIRYMEKNKPPFKIIAPGRVYRRDTIDATHTAVFHQIEILAIDKIGKLNFGSLKATIIHFLEKMFGDDIKTRFRGSYFPFTEPSVEVDVFFKGKWLEVLGCGMVDPAVLENVGLDPEEWGGFAAGFGAERFAMVMHEIQDIRELYKSDLRFLRQGMAHEPWNF